MGRTRAGVCLDNRSFPLEKNTLDLFTPQHHSCAYARPVLAVDSGRKPGYEIGEHARSVAHVVVGVVSCEGKHVVA